MKSRQAVGISALVLVLAGSYVLNFGLYPRYFTIEWDEEVKLHDGRTLIVHVKRTFERRAMLQRWLAYDRDTEISFDAGPPLGKFKRKFDRYDVTMIEQQDDKLFIGLEVTTGIPPVALIDSAFPILIVAKDGSERPASSWADIPDFPRQNIMPVTPSPEGILPFSDSLLTWQTKMDHWKNHRRAAGDDGLIIQRHTEKKVEVK